MSSSLNSHIVDLVAPRARQTALASERRRALLLALAGKIGYVDRIMGVYRINSGSVSGNRPPGFFQVKHIQTLCYFNVHTQFQHDKLIARRLDREREALYLAYLNGRAWYVRALSVDYFRFKLRNVLRRRRQRFVG